MGDAKSGRITRQLGAFLDEDDVLGFVALLETDISTRQFNNIRTQKLLMRGTPATRHAAAEACSHRAPLALDPEAAQEFERYAALCIEIGHARDQLRIWIEGEKNSFPRLSLRQLLHVAERCFDKTYDAVVRKLPNEGPDLDAGENARRLHDRSGNANDLLFAVTRAINLLTNRLGERDLRRPDALASASLRFRRLATLASQLNGIEYVLDSASFGDFRVTEVDLTERRFKLDFTDMRRVLLRQLHIRRTLVQTMMGRRNGRFVREQLSYLLDAMISNALNAYRHDTSLPDDAENRVHKDATALLWCIEAEDDLAYVAAGPKRNSGVLYLMAFLMRLFTDASAQVKRELSGKPKRDFDDSIHLAEVVAAIEPPEAQRDARDAWQDLVIGLPVRSHFDILRRPFVQTSPGIALPFRPGVYGAWTMAIRETLINGGDTGRRYGAVWEEFIASTFNDTGWTIAGRNIKLSREDRYLTEVDLLLLRGDLLLVVEVKALIGSGMSPYDHWKNRIVIEKGCRQVLVAAEHLSQNPSILASVTNKQKANGIRHIQPIVLTNESMFDGWEHVGVPVIGETIRHAITEGSRVEYFNGSTSEVLRVDHHLRVEDLSTETILAALRAPIELKIAPEQGAVRHIWEGAAGLSLGIPDAAVGAPEVTQEPNGNDHARS